MRPRYQLFGDYILLRKIATGGMAEVQLAIKRGPGRFNRLVALKTILSHRTDHEAFISMFYNEARLGARFNHPNLVNVFDVHEIDDTLTMVMEYVPGATVSELVRRCVDSGIDFRRAYALRVVLDSCLGLYHAHHLRDLDGTPLEVVHRDVSPQNILVGYSGQVKVFDFGIASTGSSPESEQLSGVLAGKYAYMSPEQCHGAELDERSDVFSLGILLWELTTKQRLFRRKNQIEVLRAITEESVKPPSSVIGDYPDKLERIVMGALERDPDKRYQTALELHDALLDYAALAREQLSSTSLGRFMEEVYGDEIESEWASLALALEQIQESGLVEITGNRRGSLAAPNEDRDDADTEDNEAVAASERSADVPPPPPTRPPSDEREMGLEALAARAVRDSSDSLVTSSAVHSTVEITLADALQRSRRLSAILAIALFLSLAGAATAVLLLVTGRQASSMAADIPPDMGQLSLDSEPPGATIFVNGVQRAELTPAVVEAALGEPLDVQLLRDGFHEGRATVTATLEAPYQNLSLALVPLTVEVESGTLRIVSSPADAVVYIDGSLRGRGTPLIIDDLPLNESHTLRVEREGYDPRELDFELTSEATREMRLDLQAAVPLGLLTVRTQPAGARVLVDGQSAGLTPLEELPLVSGREFLIELELEGYRSERERVALDADEVRVIDERLRARRRDSDEDDDAQTEPEDTDEPDQPLVEPVPDPEEEEEDSRYELLP